MSNSALFENCFCRLLARNNFPKMPSGNIYHYTSASGFNSILQGSKNGYVTLWASRFDCLNDKTEGELAIKVYRQVCSELNENGKISKEFYDMIINVKLPEKVLFPFTPEEGRTSQLLKCQGYVTSFSAEKDSLPMWNYYSKGKFYEGYNLGFNPASLLEELDNNFKKKFIKANVFSIIYNEEKQKDLIKEEILALYKDYQEEEKDLLTDYISQRLFEWRLCFKSDKFEHEKEVRAVIYVAEEKNDIEIKYRTYNGYIIPYIEIEVSKELLESVSFGPLLLDESEKARQKEIMINMLKSYNYCVFDGFVNFSEIPVRY